MKYVAVAVWLVIQTYVTALQYLIVAPIVLFAMLCGYRNTAALRPWIIPQFWVAPKPVPAPVRLAPIVHQHRLTIAGPVAAAKVTCRHCASAIPAETQCPNCGALPDCTTR
jgi:hypothetical protein